jgi:hypothetical protein
VASETLSLPSDRRMYNELTSKRLPEEITFNVFCGIPCGDVNLFHIDPLEAIARSYHIKIVIKANPVLVGNPPGQLSSRLHSLDYLFLIKVIGLVVCSDEQGVQNSRPPIFSVLCSKNLIGKCIQHGFEPAATSVLGIIDVTLWMGLLKDPIEVVDVRSRQASLCGDSILEVGDGDGGHCL